MLLDAYDAYKGGFESWKAGTQVASEAAGTAQARWFSVGPTWMRNANATSTTTVGILAGDFAANAVQATLFPIIGVAAFLPAIESYVGELRDAPSHTKHGAVEAWEGAKAGQVDRSAEGVAEMCGGISVLVSAALPFVKGAGAISVRTTPITMFPEGVPVAKGSAPIAAALPSLPASAAPAPVAPLRIAPKLTLSQRAFEHIVHRHWETAGRSALDPPAGHFSEAFSSPRKLRSAVEVAGERGQWSRAGGTRWRVQYDAGEVTGIDRNGIVAKRIEFIVEPNGSIVTAYPIP